MQLEAFVTWLLVGLMAGYLGGLLERTGCLRISSLDSLAASLVGSSIFQVIEISPEGWRVAMGGVAFVGAATMIVGQRWWYPHT